MAIASFSAFCLGPSKSLTVDPSAVMKWTFWPKGSCIAPSDPRARIVWFWSAGASKGPSEFKNLRTPAPPGKQWQKQSNEKLSHKHPSLRGNFYKISALESRSVIATLCPRTLRGSCPRSLRGSCPRSLRGSCFYVTNEKSSVDFSKLGSQFCRKKIVDKIPIVVSWYSIQKDILLKQEKLKLSLRVLFLKH